MFRGHSERNLDPKGRLMLPPEFREEVLKHSPEGKLMLTNFDDCVVGYPMPEWERIEESFQRINVLNAKLRNLQRFIISGAVEVVLDKQGRILVLAVSARIRQTGQGLRPGRRGHQIRAVEQGHLRVPPTR